jgi:hypothetical protein
MEAEKINASGMFCSVPALKKRSAPLNHCAPSYRPGTTINGRVIVLYSAATEENQ